MDTINKPGTSGKGKKQKANHQKQQRAPNFTKTQKSFMLQLILEKQDIIESDNKNYMSVMRRTEEWKSIAASFSLQFPDFARSDTQVKDFWRRQKIAAQKKRTVANKSINKTGGGPKEADLSVESEAILGAIGGASDPLQNSYDDDADPDNCDPDSTMTLEDMTDDSDDELVISNSRPALKQQQEHVTKGKMASFQMSCKGNHAC